MKEINKHNYRFYLNGLSQDLEAGTPFPPPSFPRHTAFSLLRHVS